MTTTTQLTANVAPNAVQPFEVTNADGSSTALVIPEGFVFVATDISMQRVSAVGTADLFHFSIQQNLESGATSVRWAYTGQVAENLERTFNDGIVFSTAPAVRNGRQSADSIIVRVWGHFAAQY